MNYNIVSGLGLHLLTDETNSRAKLDTGTFCNYECEFCYYLEDLDKQTSLDIIKKRADEIKSCGISEVDLSGGESSVHPNWFEILSYCKALGFQKISCLSNGSKFSNFDFLEKSKSHGLSEILFSVHGQNEEEHDDVVRRKGAFRKLIAAIENAKKLNIEVRINCTVTEKNAPGLEKYARLINELFPGQINFLPLNYWGDAKKLSPHSYQILSNQIKKAIDLISKEIEINVRYIPFCYMTGYEKHVVGVYQHIFDKKDWNILTYGNNSLAQVELTLSAYFNRAKEKRVHSYYKPKKCLDCQCFDICDGVEMVIGDKQELYPVKGEKIKDVLHFKRETR